MKRIAYKTMTKYNWPPGPWMDEPDKVQWTNRTTGLPCLAVRQSESGHWCGYVGVSEGHPAYEQHYDNVDVLVHGGLTFSAHCMVSPFDPGGELAATAVCHVVEPGEDDHVWWLGFDCIHSGDRSPANRFEMNRDWDTYRSLRYVQRQCGELAKQLVMLGVDQVRAGGRRPYWREASTATLSL